MKNISLILNLVLAVAVTILYFLHFQLKNSCSTDGGDVEKLHV